MNPNGTDQINQGSNGRISTGSPGLDDVLSGGLPRSHLFLVQGEPGTGKTTLGLQFLLAGARDGEQVMYVTLSESRRELEGVAESHHWSLDNVSIFEFVARENSLLPEEQYSAFHPAELEFQDTTQHILKEVERVQPTRIVFDSLSEIRLLARDSLRYRRQILGLKHYFANRNCTVLLLDDGTADGSDQQLQSIAHGVVLMERIQREYGVERRRIRVGKMRGCQFREGYHDYTIETGGIAVYPRLVASEHIRDDEGGMLSSGLKELDAMWGGGLKKGTSTLMIGPAGCGKSSLAMSYAVAAARRGEFAAVYVFDETRHSALWRAAHLNMDPAPLIDAGRMTVDQVDPAELSPGQFVDRVRKTVTEDGARVVVIDSLNGFMNAMPGEDFVIIQMHELLTFLNQNGVITILVLAQAGLVGTMSSAVDLSYLADNVLLLRYFEAAGKVRKALAVVKQRSGEHEDTIRELSVVKGRIKVGAPLADFHGVLTGVPSFSPARQPSERNRHGVD